MRQCNKINRYNYYYAYIYGVSLVIILMLYFDRGPATERNIEWILHKQLCQVKMGKTQR